MKLVVDKFIKTIDVLIWLYKGFYGKPKPPYYPRLKYKVPTPV